MVVNGAVENALATIGAVLWCVQILPQIWKSWRAKSTTGLSPWLMFTWMISLWVLGIYNITQKLSIPLHIQPELCGFAPPPLDAFAASSYLIVVGMELLILLLATILNPIAYYRRRDEKVTEVIEEIETIDKIVSSKDYVANAEANINRPTDLDDAFAEWF
ncbi:unnamed protein product [Adineta steineri]|uniref:Uncharacterized protein n=1 Tax=Adineta steineri TaxID=433720 RepID=A0A813Y0V3_9BILA|nr:unnamed protein product [Adineta steineri]